MTQYRLLSYRKWLSIGYWARYLNIWNVVANNSEQGIYLSSANIYHQRTGGDVPWWPGCTPAELLPMTQYSILSHNKLLSIEYWVIKDTESLYCNISTLCIVRSDNNLTLAGRVPKLWSPLPWLSPLSPPPSSEASSPPPSPTALRGCPSTRSNGRSSPAKRQSQVLLLKLATAVSTSPPALCRAVTQTS